MFFSFKDVEYIPMEIEIHRWFMGLGIVDDQLTVIDLHYHMKQIVAKFKTHELFDNFLQKHKNGVPYEKNAKTYTIPVIVAGSPWKKVQIKYVPDEMDFEYVHTALEQYGKVKGIEWEKPNLDLLKTKREKLSVEMMVTKNIPLFITIMGMRFTVAYTGQVKTCARCDSDQHEARNCDGGRRTYSQALGSSPAAVTLAIQTLEEIVKDAENMKKARIEEHDAEKMSGSEYVDSGDSGDSGDEGEWKQQQKRGRKGWKDARKRKNVGKANDSVEKDNNGQTELQTPELRRKLKKVKPNLTTCRQRLVKKHGTPCQGKGEAKEAKTGSFAFFPRDENRNSISSTTKKRNEEVEEIMDNEWPNTGQFSPELLDPSIKAVNEAASKKILDRLDSANQEELDLHSQPVETMKEDRRSPQETEMGEKTAESFFKSFQYIEQNKNPETPMEEKEPQYLEPNLTPFL